MKTRIPFVATLCAAAALAGCTVNPPLMFGDSLTYGLQIGSDAGGTGTGGALGYRQRSVAVVPVSVLDENGRGNPINSTHDRTGNNRLDALSVFASFENSVFRSGDDQVGLGQIFATGLAAQTVSAGVRCKMVAGAGCQATLEEARAASAASTAAADANRELSQPLSLSLASLEEPPKATVSPSGPYQAPLYFGRTDTLGIGLGQSSAEQGFQFELGYTSRNVALIPAFTRGTDGRIQPLVSGVVNGEGEEAPHQRDAMSVLGQFQLNTKTRALGLDLTRFFATGMAAQNIATGMLEAWVEAKQREDGAREEAMRRAAAPGVGDAATAGATALVSGGHGVAP
jgi:hypothetical protein